jgi:prostaglandin-E synthase
VKTRGVCRHCPVHGLSSSYHHVEYTKDGTHIELLNFYFHAVAADVKDESITLTDTGLEFKGKSQDKDYSVSIEFLKSVDSEGSTYKVLPRSVQMNIMKKDKEEEEFWPRLLKDKALEKNQVKIDWDRYVDEDEEEEGFDMSNLEGGSG